MPGVKGFSGGHNRKSVDQHRLEGTFQRSRHAPAVAGGPPAPLSAASRRRTLAGLSTGARRMAVALLDSYDGWDAAALSTLRSYVLSCERLEQLQAAGPGRLLYAELRANVALLRLLNMEKPR